jgi:spore germination protein YaaH
MITTAKHPAGPVAPLSCKCDFATSYDSVCLDQDIVSHLSAMIKNVPSEKIVLGVPFYGYEWQTASKNFLANTYPGTGALATYARIQTLFSDPKISSLSAMWSEKTFSPYLTFEQEGKIYQIYFENNRSLEEKVKLIKSANLGGIAIWALGYETPHKDLWGPIKTLITP